MVIALASLALIFAMVGLIGILSYSVQQQVRDFGVRRALGATTNDVLRLVVGSAARRVSIPPSRCATPEVGALRSSACPACRHPPPNVWPARLV
jgi:hypothetical protein